MEEIKCPQDAAMLLERLEAAGHEAYVVGGCVRDALLGQTPHDWDITTSASPEEVKAALPGLHILDTGLKHGTVTVVLEDLYEITTFRVDGRYSDGRHPDEVRFTRRLEDDLSRRDFTMNAMAWSPRRGLADLFGGVEDLKNRVIRCVGDGEQRMEEDALRVMRAVRFQSRLGFSVAPETKRAVKRHIPNLARVSAERVCSEFRQTVAAPYAARAIRETPELFCFLVPALGARIDGAGVLEHTLAALEAAGRQDGVFPPEWADETVRLALFFNDLGAEAAEETMRAMKFSGEMLRNVRELTALHDAELEVSRPSVKRWMGRLSEEQLRRLLKVMECDAAGRGELAAPRLERCRSFWELERQLRAERAAVSVKDLAVNGGDLMNIGIPAGKMLGRALNALLDEVIDEKLPNDQAALLQRARAFQETRRNGED